MCWVLVRILSAEKSVKLFLCGACSSDLFHIRVGALFVQYTELYFWWLSTFATYWYLTAANLCLQSVVHNGCIVCFHKVGTIVSQVWAFVRVLEYNWILTKSHRVVVRHWISILQHVSIYCIHAVYIKCNKKYCTHIYIYTENIYIGTSMYLYICSQYIPSVYYSATMYHVVSHKYVQSLQ